MEEVTQEQGVTQEQIDIVKDKLRALRGSANPREIEEYVRLTRQLAELQCVVLLASCLLSLFLTQPHFQAQACPGVGT